MNSTEFRSLEDYCMLGYSYCCLWSYQLIEIPHEIINYMQLMMPDIKCVYYAWFNMTYIPYCQEFSFLGCEVDLYIHSPIRLHGAVLK
jgi:hypothetical protein